MESKGLGAKENCTRATASSHRATGTRLTMSGPQAKTEEGAWGGLCSAVGRWCSGEDGARAKATGPRVTTLGPRVKTEEGIRGGLCSAASGWCLTDGNYCLGEDGARAKVTSPRVTTVDTRAKTKKGTQVGLCSAAGAWCWPMTTAGRARMVLGRSDWSSGDNVWYSALTSFIFLSMYWVGEERDESNVI